MKVRKIYILSLCDLCTMFTLTADAVAPGSALSADNSTLRETNNHNLEIHGALRYLEVRYFDFQTRLRWCIFSCSKINCFYLFEFFISCVCFHHKTNKNNHKIIKFS